MSGQMAWPDDADVLNAADEGTMGWNKIVPVRESRSSWSLNLMWAAKGKQWSSISRGLTQALQLDEDSLLHSGPSEAAPSHLLEGHCVDRSSCSYQQLGGVLR